MKTRTKYGFIGNFHIVANPQDFIVRCTCVCQSAILEEYWETVGYVLWYSFNILYF